MASILVLEDEADLRTEIADYLSDSGHEVHAVETIRQFLAYFKTDPPDIVIIDRMVPDGDGLTVVEDMRIKGLRVGVIMFSALSRECDRLQGYSSGVDHYLVKPVRMQELGAVVASLSWRLQADRLWRLMLKTWELKSPAGKVIGLTSLEASFLNVLVQNAGTAISRRRLLEAMGKNLHNYDPRNLDALLLRLRKKVATITLEALPVKTVHGVGYIAPANALISEK